MRVLDLSHRWRDTFRERSCSGLAIIQHVGLAIRQSNVFGLLLLGSPMMREPSSRRTPASVRGTYVCHLLKTSLATP